MCEYLKRMSPQDTPTDDIRRWSSLAHSVVEYTGPRPFGMDGNVYLWLHERSATQLLDMCDELDAKFSDLKSENAKLRAERDHLLVNSNPTAAELRRVRSAWKKDRDENAKLRELVCKYGEYTSQDRCEGCVVKSRCNDGEIEECWQLTEIRRLASELGVEVDG